MSDNKGTKQAPAVEAEARDERSGYFVYDPEGNGFDFYATDTQREAAHKAAIEECRKAAFDNGEWPLAVEDIVSGIVTHKTVASNIEGESYDYQAHAALSRASEAAEEPIGWFQLKPEFGSDRIGIRWNGDGRLNDGQALYAAAQPASEQQATHVSVPRELFQDLVEEVSDYAASRKFRKSEIEWRKERIEAAWAILAAKGDGHV